MVTWLSHDFNINLPFPGHLQMNQDLLEKNTSKKHPRDRIECSHKIIMSWDEYGILTFEYS